MNKYCAEFVKPFLYVVTGMAILISQGFSQKKEDIQVLTQQFISRLAQAGTIKTESLNNSINLEIIEKNAEPSLQTQPDDVFHIKVTLQKIIITSSTFNGLKNGMFWYLQYLGYRFYFPNEAWYYIPELPTLYKPVDTIVSPSFTYRRIWYAYGTGSAKADKDYRFWVDANLLGGQDVNAGHSYDGIVNRNKSVFVNNPQFFAQKTVAGKIPKNPKFEVGNEQLVKLVIDDALQQVDDIIKKTGKLPGMISMDPSDGGGFSTSPESLKIGGATEQTFYLANRVANAVRQKYPLVKIGLYAYNEHAAPPDFPIENNIVVLIATAMNQSKYRTDELIDLWKKKGVQVGIRDYYGVMAWDWDMPGRPNGSKFSYIKNLKEFNKSGVNLFSAETNIGWISRGLGHYVAARLLWNVNENINEITDEFFAKMFIKAAGPVRQLFDIWQTYKEPVPTARDLKAWSKLIEAASLAEDNKAVQQRLSQVKRYMHYVVLYKKWKDQPGDQNLIKLLSYAYRIQNEGSVASYPLFRRLASKDMQDQPGTSFKNENAVWKNNKADVSAEETEQLFKSDFSYVLSDNVSEKQLPVAFKGKAKKEKLLSEQNTSPVISLRGSHKILFNVSGGNSFINLTSGLIKAKQYKSLRLSIYNYNKALRIEDAKPILSEIIAPKQPLKSISLKGLSKGNYFAVLDDAKNGFKISFTGNVSYGLLAGNQSKAWTFGRNNLVFNVDDNKDFTIMNQGAITITSPKGRVIDMQKEKGEKKISVLQGETGIWKITNQSGIFELKGIFPIVSSNEDYLLSLEQ